MRNGLEQGTAEHERVTVGLATWLGMFSVEEWMTSKNQMEVLSLKTCPPQINLYMTGRPCEDGTRTVPLGLRTRVVARIRQQHRIRVAISNDVENTFTSQDYLDLFILASLGVSVFQVRAEPEWRELLRLVTGVCKGGFWT